MTNAFALLTTMLPFAVPMHAMEIASWPESKRAAALADAVAAYDENVHALLVPGPVPGQSAAAFNSLAKALAILAFRPEGVEALGLRWKFPPPAALEIEP